MQQSLSESADCLRSWSLWMLKDDSQALSPPQRIVSHDAFTVIILPAGFSS